MQSIMPKWLPVTIAVIAFIGFLDASYLAALHFLGEIPPCTIGGCEVVTTSKYATILGVPVALLGALYYLFIFLKSVSFIHTGNIRTIRVTATFTIFGLLASVYFVFLQVFILKAICVYCILSAITSTILFALGCIVVSKVRYQQNDVIQSQPVRYE